MLLWDPAWEELSRDAGAGDCDSGVEDLWEFGRELGGDDGGGGVGQAGEGSG